jgi:putative redox protein
LTVAETGIVTVRWREAERFEGAAGTRLPILIDGDSQVAPSPVELLLMAAASCTGTDVVSILTKQRVELQSLEIRVGGSRRDTQPRRYTAMRFEFLVSGVGVTEAKARRAIDLSLEKYCSVVASLAPDIAISYDLVLR